MLALLAALGVTVLVLAVTVVTGLKAIRRVHLTFVALSLVSLGVSVYFAERLGRHYDLESAGLVTTIHLTLARVTTAGFLLPLVTGFLTLKNPLRRRLHGRVVFLILALVVVTLVFGVWMIVAAEPLQGS